MEYMYVEELVYALTSLLSTIPYTLLGIAVYVFGAVGLYAVAQRRGIRNPWLAWVPVANRWVLGSLSDQYQYVVQGQVKNKRKTLLILYLVNAILSVAAIVVGILFAAELMLDGFSMELLLGLLGLGLTIAVIGIAGCILRWIALYDVYKSLDPGNSTLYLIISILFSFTEGFFLFFNRNKDEGMPPRKQQIP